MFVLHQKQHMLYATVCGSRWQILVEWFFSGTAVDCFVSEMELQDAAN
jgi:hypothetical protein